MRSPSPFEAPLEQLLQQEAKPPEKYGHQPRLYLLTRELGEGFDYDEDVVCAGAYLHDLGVFTGHRPEDPDVLARWDHVAYAISHVPGMLRKLDFPQDKVPAVLEVIRCHQPKDDPGTLEGIILRDADILEQLGAIGILRTVAKVGRDTRFPTFTPAVEALERALQTLPQQLRLPAARELAAPRIACLQMFVDAVRTEAANRLY